MSLSLHTQRTKTRPPDKSTTHVSIRLLSLLFRVSILVKRKMKRGSHIRPEWQWPSILGWHKIGSLGGRLFGVPRRVSHHPSVLWWPYYRVDLWMGAYDTTGFFCQVLMDNASSYAYTEECLVCHTFESATRLTNCPPSIISAIGCYCITPKNSNVAHWSASISLFEALSVLAKMRHLAKL